MYQFEQFEQPCVKYCTLAISKQVRVRRSLSNENKVIIMMVTLRE